METARQPDELAFTARGTHLLVVDAAGAGLSGRREAWLPPDATALGTGPVEVRYVVAPRPPVWNGRAKGYRVVRDGTTRYLGADVESLLRWLRADIDATLARRAGAPLAVRAAAVTWRGRAIVMPGQPGAGTSRLAAALVRLGADAAAESGVLIDGNGRLRPHAAAAPLDLALVVATTYHPLVSWQPRRAHGARAVLPLIECALPTDDAPRALLRRLACLAPGLVALQGPRPDAATVAPGILAALDELLDTAPARRPPLPPAIVRARRALVERAVLG